MSVKKYFFPALFLLVVLFGIGVYYYLYELRDAPGQRAEENTNSLTASTTDDGNVTAGDFEAEIVPGASIPKTAKFPNIERPFTVPASFPPGNKAKLESQYADLYLALKQDPTNYEAWADVAIYRKTIDDYAGAREIWEFLLLYDPNSAPLNRNLGSLYHLYFKEYQTAEGHLKKALSLDGTDIATYRALHDLYRYSYKQSTTAAADILKQGLVINNSIELRVMLAYWYMEHNQTAEAKVYVEQAIVEAEKYGDEALVKNLKNLLATL